MGELAARQTSNACKARFEAREEDNEPENPCEVVGQVESLLGGEESPQEVTLRNSYFH